MKKQVCTKIFRTLVLVVLAALLAAFAVACDGAAKVETKYYSNLIIDQYEWKFVGLEAPEDRAAYKGECTYYSNGSLKKVRLEGVSEFFAGEQMVLEFDRDGNIIGGKSTYIVDGETINETIVTTYDKSGNCIKVEYVRDDGAVIGYNEYEYDESNNCIGRKIYDDGSLVGRYACEYDQNGNCIKITHYNEYNAKASEIESVFDENNNCVKYTYMMYGDDGTVWDWEDIELDELGNKVKVIRRKSDGSIKSWNEYEYDENGERLKYITYNADGTVSGTTEFNYDEIGNQIGQTYYDSDGTITGKWEYDADGNSIQTNYNDYGNISNQSVTDKNGNFIKSVQYNSDGEIDSWWQYEYNENGNRTKAVSYKGDGTIESRSEYEYDENGNKIKEISYSSDGKIQDSYEYNVMDQNLAKWTIYDEDGKIIRYHTYEYNADGKQSKELVYNADGVLQEYTIIERTDTEWIEKTYSFDGILERLVEFKPGERQGSWYSAISTTYYKNGNVKSIVENDKDFNVIREVYYTETGEIEERNENNEDQGGVYEPDPNTHTEFDANGNLVKLTMTDDAGRVTNICNFGEDGQETSQIVYSYYDNGKVSKCTETIYGVGSTRIEYYENGNKKQEVTYNAAGNPLVITMYDENGNVINTIDRTGNE